MATTNPVSVRDISLEWSDEFEQRGAHFSEEEISEIKEVLSETFHNFKGSQELASMIRFCVTPPPKEGEEYDTYSVCELGDKQYKIWLPYDHVRGFILNSGAPAFNREKYDELVQRGVVNISDEEIASAIDDVCDVHSKEEMMRSIAMAALEISLRDRSDLKRALNRKATLIKTGAATVLSVAATAVSALFCKNLRQTSYATTLFVLLGSGFYRLLGLVGGYLNARDNYISSEIFDLANDQLEACQSEIFAEAAKTKQERMKSFLCFHRESQSRYLALLTHDDNWRARFMGRVVSVLSWITNKIQPA